MGDSTSSWPRRGADRPPAGQRRVVLGVEDLDGAPGAGGCCGAIARDDLVVDELESWPGLQVLDIDPDAGTVVVRIAAGCAHLEHAVEALCDRGLPTRVLHQTPG